jgi:hypothetical protein
MLFGIRRMFKPSTDLSSLKARRRMRRRRRGGGGGESKH